MKSKLLVIIGIIVAIVVSAVITYDYIILDKLCKDSGGKLTGDLCQIPIFTNSTINNSEIDFDISQIKTMKPNSMEFFYYPNPQDTENRDVFQKFILIRLPENLGGDVDDVSAFRAYSAVAITDHCLVKYWPQEGRQRMENLCRGGMYRAIDGLLTQNVDPIRITTPMALPHLDLSMDENGALYVEPPTWTIQENGVIGIGRQMSLQEIQQGSEFLIDHFEKSHSKFPLIPLSFTGHTLSEIKLDGNRIVVNYFHFSLMSGGVSADIGLVTAQDQQSFLNLKKSNSDFLQIGETVIKVSGTALEKNNDQPEQFKEYEIQFIKDGYNFRFEGKNLEFMKKEIVTNYFPENEYDDMILISKNE